MWFLDWHPAPDAKHWHRLWSVRFAVLGAAASVALAVFPGLLGVVNPYEHPGHYAGICGGLFIATLISRLIDQPSVPNG